MKVKSAPFPFPFLSILFLILLTLKLAQIGVVASWSWLAVTAPLWVPVAVVLIVGTVLAVLYGIAAVADNARRAHRRRALVNSTGRAS